MNIESYLRGQQRCNQWDHALFSIAREMERHLEPDALRHLMYQAGVRMAEGFPVDENGSLHAVAEILNGIWQSSDWGWVELTENDRGIHIEHAFSPLREALGDPDAVWSGQLLAGFYASLFKQLGAGEELQLRQIESHNRDIFLFELTAAV